MSAPTCLLPIIAPCLHTRRAGDRARNATEQTYADRAYADRAFMRMCDGGMRWGMETFREIVERLQPPSVALAKLSRAADIDYNYLLKLMRDTRPGMTLHPKPDKGEKLLDALQNKFGVTITEADRMAMLNACVSPPEGFRLVPEAHAITYDTDEGARRVAEAYRGAQGPIRAAFDALASVPAAEAYQGDDEPGETSPEDVAMDMDRQGALGRRLDD